MIILEVGEINYSKHAKEWFDMVKQFQILHNGCSNKSHLRICVYLSVVTISGV